MENHHFERVNQPKNGDLTEENDDLAISYGDWSSIFEKPINYK